MNKEKKQVMANCQMVEAYGHFKNWDPADRMVERRNGSRFLSELATKRLGPGRFEAIDTGVGVNSIVVGWVLKGESK